MTINVGVKALLCWVNTLKLSDHNIAINDLQDGTVLLKVVCMLKREHNCHFSNSIEERYKLIADFVERDCRFTATKGTSVSWDNIRHEINLTVEIAKVLLLLIYHDMMNERCTVNSLDCEVEQEIAHLTESFVMESDGCVFLSKRLDSYLARRRISVSREIFERSATTSTSNVSTISSLTDDESPVFDRRQRVTFVDMQTVASSSVSNSPLQNIMNTPKFQLRKMERQMIRERDHRDGLESELSSKIALLAQRESHCDHLQYCLDKLKKEQHEQENCIKDQINELETKNNSLQMRLTEMLKQNKDLKCNASLMERKVDELSDENGVLSSQMRSVCSQLAIFEAEVGRLTETQAFSEEDWRRKTGHLQSELNQATAQKELLTEQIQILQGKISCLEDVINRASKEEVGENMGPVMERDMLDTEIKGLKDELESTSCSLKKAEVEIQAKTQQLADYRQELNQQKELMQQQESRTEEIIQAKDGILDKLQKEITEQRAVLQQEILELKAQLEQVTQQKTEQITGLQQHIAACEQEIEKLKEIKKEKESLLRQIDENMKELETKLSAATSLLADKDQQINSLREEVEILTDETKNNKNEIQAKEEGVAKLLLEKSTEQDIFRDKIQTLSVQVKELSLSLKQAEQEIQLKQDIMAKTQQENVQQRELLQQQIVTCEEEVHKLNQEIQIKNEQLVIVKNDSSRQSESLEQEITSLKAQLENLNDSLRKAEEQVQAQEVILTKQEEQSAHQTVVLHQQLSVSEERVRSMIEEIQTKEEQMNMLKNQSLQQSELLHQEIQDLKKQVECLLSSLKNAEEDLRAKENLFAAKSKQEQQSTLQIEALKKHSAVLEDEVNQLKGDIRTKEGVVDLLKVESGKESEELQKEIHTLRDQVQSLNESLKTTIKQVQAKEYLLTQKEMEISQAKDAFQNMATTSEEEIKALKEKIQSKEEQLVTIEKEGSKHSEMLQQEIQCLKNQLANLGDSLTKTEEEVQTQVAMLTKQEQESAHQKEELQRQLSASEEEVRKMKDEIQAKEEQMILLKTESSEESDLRHQEIQSLKEQVECLSSSLRKAEEDMQSKMNHYRETQTTDLRLKEAVQVATLSEKEALVQEKEVLMARILQAEKNQKSLEKQLETMVFEKERLAQAKQAIKKENEVSHKLESMLQQELEIIRMEKEKLLEEKAEEIETLKRDLQQQLSVKSEAAEHYKAQMEKAMSCYNGKKRLLQESQEETVELKHSLEVKEHEVKATTMELRLLKLDLDKAQTNEKALLNRVASLEAQLAFADRNLRLQNKIHGNEGSATESGYLHVPKAHSSVHTRAQVKRTMSSDSLDHSSLEDSLNITRKLAVPEESSTPLVRSSERLAAKRGKLQAESLETLYFTPINTRQSNRTSTEHKMELDSACKNLTSSVKRRRTTQVINITMTQKTPGGSEHDETFYSLASARSQPNLSSANSARPVSMDLLDTPVSDQFIGLPGYRRSTVHSQTTSTFCVGEENEPEGAPDDWMRIAELQARNKACLPHLKSSYPVECDTGRGTTFLFTDEELRMGDPSDTIRRASMMPGQMQESLASHRHSLMVGQTTAAASTRSHRHSLMPGQLPSKTVGSSQLRSPKGTKRSSSTLSVHQTSPEKKVRTSCFPRPLTPKNKNMISGPSGSQLQARALSPAHRRQSMMFTIDSTPKNSNYLKKGLNKLRGSARKSPGKSVRKLPAQTSDPQPGVVRAGRTGSSKSPQVTTKGQKATSRAAKSPGLTASARKKRGSVNEEHLSGFPKR
ncbi:nuclear mitotic apparatus protein 1 isoform X1 [Etheostoma cragini]|uniref:nuclear mitotic apparatus protein 1 isoform X1 n=1 Tax=Etheostoma cragini TaxID=417921 RepID=UPI00155E1C48|nr:nuclear mitotic apparatus protein 1 isoform X1 [Etheostoma cragini]